MAWPVTAYRETAGGKWKPRDVQCAECSAPLKRRIYHPVTKEPIKAFFCNFVICRAAWQRRQKPVDEAWLRQKYLVERVDCAQISKIVGRNSKQVWQWLKGYGIETRKRGGTGNGFKKGQISPFKGKRQARGAASPHWQGGITPERQALYASDEWRAAVCVVYGRARK